MQTQKLDPKATCVKCGFTPSYTQKWELAFKNDCTIYGYHKCEWNDATTKEHLHQTCPDCGFTDTVPCLDSEAVKANTWSTSGGKSTENLDGTFGLMKPEAMEAAKAIRGTLPVAPTIKPAVAGTPATIKPTTPYVAPVRPIHQSTTPAKCRTCPVEAK